MPESFSWLHFIVYAIVIIMGVLLLVMGFIYFERRGLGRFQVRLGPNRVGPFGLLQPVADAVKVLMKEDIVPDMADKLVHLLAPVLMFVPVIMVFAVIPFSDGAIMADLNIGLLYIVAITTFTTLGGLMAGWASCNKYSLLAAMRSVAQMVSYEIPLVFSIIGVVIVAGSLSMTEIVEKQTIPFILLQPLGFFIFFLGTSAEINRTPFDQLEAESEIVAGIQTEYSGMKFAMFYLAEYGHALTASAIITTIYLGGWKGPLLPPVLWFLIKVFAVFWFIFWVRATLPRLRIDQVMAFAWKGLFPLSILNMFITAAEMLLWPTFPWPLVFVNFAAAAVLVILWSKFSQLGGGRVEV